MKAFCTLGLLSALLAPPSVMASDIGELYQQTNKSVVVLHTYESKPITSRNGSSRLTSAQSLGSGVLISKDGHVATAAHVVHIADSVHVEFANGKKVIGRVVASDPAADIAMIKVDRVPESATVAKLGDSDTAKIGDRVFVIGAPYGVGQTLTVGYISGRHTQKHALKRLEFVELLQTDAAINQGNSGGPMFNMAGEVIGIASHILTKSGGFVGLGFTVSSNTVRRLLVERKGVWTGLQVKYVSGKLAAILNVPQDAGILVERVAAGSPGQAAGLRPGDIPLKIEGREVILGGDIILAVDGIKVEDEDSLAGIYKRIGVKKPKEPFDIGVWRKGHLETVRMQLTR
jgi:serine protease Do